MKAGKITVIISLFLLIAAAYSSCSSTPLVQPLKKGKSAVDIKTGCTASYKSDIKETIPLFVCNMSYGATNWLTIHAGISAALTFNLGALIGLREATEKHPGISLDTSIALGYVPEYGIEALSPEINLNIYYQREKTLWYWGAKALIPYFVFNGVDVSDSDFTLLAKGGLQAAMMEKVSIFIELGLGASLENIDSDPGICPSGMASLSLVYEP